MTIKFEEVGPYSDVLLNLFNTVKEEVVVYDPEFDDDYVTNVWMPAIAAAYGIVPTTGLISMHKDNTKERNGFMKDLRPVSWNLQYVIKKCIKAGTITDTLSSFGLSGLRKCINLKDYDGFHTAYEVVFGQATTFHTALIAKGFSALKIASIKTLHDKAQNKQQTNMALETQINGLSGGNTVICDTCLGEDAKVLEMLKAYANSIDDADLAKKATWNALLKQVRPTPPRKPRNRKLKKGKTILLRSNIADKNLLQITLGTDVKVIIYRTELKSTVLAEGLELPFGEMWEGKKGDLPGTGPFVKMTNLNTLQDAVVRCFEVDM